MNRWTAQSRLFARLSLVCGLAAAGLAISSAGASATPSEGLLDPLFGTSGTLSLDASGGPSDDDPVDFAVAPDGSHYVLASSMIGSTSYRLVKVSSTGSIVTSFGTNGFAVVDTSLSMVGFKDVKVLADGKIVVSLADNSTVNILRFNADGTPDTTFDTDGKAVITAPQAASNLSASVSTNGSSWVCFRTTANMYTVRRITTAGAVDTAIGTAGDVDVWSVSGTVTCAADASGRVWAMTDNGMTGMKFGRINANGTLDQTIGTQGVFTTPTIYMNWSPYGGFADADGVSFYGFQGGPQGLGIVRITNAGVMTSVMAPLGSIWNGQQTAISDIRPLGSDFLVAAGFLNNSVTVVKVLANNTFDTTFGTQGVLTFSAGMFPVGQFRSDGSLAYIYKAMGMPADVGVGSTDASLVSDSSFGVSGVRLIDLKLGYFTWQPKAILQDSSMLVYLNSGGFRYLRMNSQGELLAGSTPEGILGAENILQGADGKIWSTGFDFMSQRLFVYRFNNDLSLDSGFNGGAPLQIATGGFVSLMTLFEVNGDLVVTNLVTTQGNPSFAVRVVTPTGTVTGPTSHSLTCCLAMNAGWGYGPRVQVPYDGALYINYSVGQYGPHVVRITTAGLDTNFGSSGKLAIAPAGFTEVQHLDTMVDANGVTVMVKAKNGQGAYKFLALRYSLSGVLDTNFGTAGIAELGDTSAMFYANMYPRANGGFVKYELLNTGANWVNTFVFFTSTGAVDSPIGTNGEVTISYPASNMAPPPQFTFDGRGGALLWRSGMTQTIARVMLGGPSVSFIAAPPTTAPSAPTTGAPNTTVAVPTPVVPITFPAPTTTTPPSTAVTAPPEAVIVALPPAVEPLAPSMGGVVTRGQQVTATFSGFAPGELVHLIVASTPRVIGSGVAGADGSVTISGVIPADLTTGAHTLAVYAPGSGHGVRQAIMVNAPMLPVTGAGATNTAALVFALFSLVFGILLIHSRRTLHAN